MASTAEDELAPDASSQQAEKASLNQSWREDSSLQYFREEFWFRMSITPRLKTLPLHYRSENGQEALLCAQHHAEQLWGQRLRLNPQEFQPIFFLYSVCPLPCSESCLRQLEPGIQERKDTNTTSARK